MKTVKHRQMRFLLLLLLAPFTLFSQGKFFGGNGDGYHMATLNAVVLPIKIESFRVRNGETKRTIELTLSSGSKACLVSLQRSQNASNFLAIDSIVSPAGATQTHFDFIDAAAIKSSIYYRCKIADCNGQITYSQVQMIHQINQRGVIIYSSLDRSIHYNLEEDADMLLYDVTGRIMLRKNLIRGQGVIQLPSLMTGIYFLKVGRSDTKTIVL